MDMFLVICGMTVLPLMRYEELIAASQTATSSTTRFSEPLIDEQLTVVQQRRFRQNTVNTVTAR